MKQAKQRVIAIDYFRGLCMLMVLLDHSSFFSMPLPYLLGAGSLWTSAAELFFLLSGLTFGVVRGGLVMTDFKTVVAKSWRRAGFLYLLNTLVVLLSIILALILTSRHLTNDVIGAVPTTSGFSLLAQVLTFSYTIGWANFFMYYAVYLLFAPFVLYALKSRLWALIPIASYVLYALNTNYPFHLMQNGIHASFATWQLYFVLGLVLARFRVPIIRWFYNLPAKRLRQATNTVILSGGLFLLIDCMLTFNFFPAMNKLALAGWLPLKAVAGYVHLLQQKAWIDGLLMNGRTGLLRPVATLIFLGVVYVIYQKYRHILLNKTGWFVNAIGRDTLWVFTAQALMIPLIAAIPVSHGLVSNLMLSTVFLYSMWLLTKRRKLLEGLRLYILQLKESFYEAKYAYLQQYEDSN